MTLVEIESGKIIYPFGDGLGHVALVNHAGNDKGVVNAARVSFGGDNDRFHQLLLNEETGVEIDLWDASGKLTFHPDLRDRRDALLALGFTDYIPPLLLKPLIPEGFVLLETLLADDVRLIRYLLRHRHGSPFEHNLITFRVKVPIFVDRQMVRHRVGVSKNEESARYTVVKDEVYVPLDFRAQAESNRQASVADDGTLDQQGALEAYEDAVVTARAAYDKLIALGVTREQARGVLPQAMYTSSYYTFNLRSLLHFLSLRDHDGAQFETRLVAQAMSVLAEPLFPETFKIWNSLKH